MEQEVSKRFAATGGREAVVGTMPNCDICANGTKAVYDGKTRMGPWAYMCESHYQSYGLGLGEGVGQKLFTSDKS
jgi:hypothetical protein